MWDNRLVRHLVRPTDTVLDLGCWDAWTWRGVQIARRVSVDICDRFPNCMEQRPLQNRPDVLWDLENTPYPFVDKSYDIVTAFNVIEHLTKEAGYRMLEEMERIATYGIIIETPKDFRDNKQHTSHNKKNLHISHWTREDFKGWKFAEHSDKTQIFCYKDM